MAHVEDEEAAVLADGEEVAVVVRHPQPRDALVVAHVLLVLARRLQHEGDA